MLLMMLVLKKK